jgi:predicted membrane channel-forming protein YqfA (hemolysin III family)
MRAATGFMRYRGGELAADRIIHTIGNFAGVVGSVMLVGIAVGVAERPIFLASLVYSICLLTMLGCSAAYNLAASASRNTFAAIRSAASIMATTEVIARFRGIRLISLPGSPRRLGDRTAVLLSILFLSPQ